MEKEQKQGNNEATLTLDINAGPTFVMAQQNSVQCPISSTELSHKKIKNCTKILTKKPIQPSFTTDKKISPLVNDHQYHRRRSKFFSHAFRLIIMLTLTFLYFLIELVTGYISHSMALIADSFHMMSDVMALSIAYACLKIAERSTTKNTFGWVRAEVLGALVNGVFLLALCFSIFVESLQRLFEPQPIKSPRNVLFVGTIGFIINIIGMSMFHGHAHHGGTVRVAEEGNVEVDNHADGDIRTSSTGHIAVNSNNDDDNDSDAETPTHLLTSHQDRAMAMAEFEAIEESLMTSSPSRSRRRSRSREVRRNHGSEHLNMRAVFLHILSDAIGSIIVICTALVSWLLPGYELLKLYMDPSLSIIMVLLMICTTLPLVRETALILLQTTPKFINLEKLKSELVNIDGVVAIHDFHVWRLVGERIIATVHIRFHSLKHYLLAAEEIRSLFHDNHIHSATIQPEFAEMESNATKSSQGLVPPDKCAFACLPTNCSLLMGTDGIGTTTVTCCDKSVGVAIAPGICAAET